MKLYNLLKPELIKVNCQKFNTEEVLKEMVNVLKSKSIISNEALVFKKLIEREKLGSTSIGNHSAVPHTKLKGLKEPVIFIVISKEGFLFHKNDKELVNFIILILSPDNSPINHLQTLAAAASLIKKSDKLIKEILASEIPEELINIIKKYENSDEKK